MLFTNSIPSDGDTLVCSHSYQSSSGQKFSCNLKYSLIQLSTVIWLKSNEKTLGLSWQLSCTPFTLFSSLRGRKEMIKTLLIPFSPFRLPHSFLICIIAFLLSVLLFVISNLSHPALFCSPLIRPNSHKVNNMVKLLLWHLEDIIYLVSQAYLVFINNSLF